MIFCSIFILFLLLVSVHCEFLGYPVDLRDDGSRADRVSLHSSDRRFANNSCAPITHLSSCDDVGFVRLAHARVSRAVRDAPAVFVAVVMDTVRPALVPHFVKHYMGLGVRAEHFVVVVNMNDTADAQRVKAFLIDAKLAFVEWWGEFTTGVKHFHLLHALSLVRQGDFVVWADLDEFHEFGDLLPSLDYKSVAGFFRANRCNALQGVLVDRVALNGELADFQSDVDIHLQFPLRCNLTHQLVYGEERKTLVTAASLVPDGGHHSVPSRLYFEERGMAYLLRNPIMQERSVRVCRGLVQSSHFKWSRGLMSYLTQRSSMFKAKHIPWWVESQRVVDRAGKRQAIDVQKFCQTHRHDGRWVPINNIQIAKKRG